MIPHRHELVKSLTPQQRRVWQRLRTAPVTPGALTPEGGIRADWLAQAWGDPSLPGALSLLYVTVHKMNVRLAPWGIRIRGSRARHGYRVVCESEAR